MIRYSLKSLQEDITGLTQKDTNWDIDKEIVRSISKTVKSIFKIDNITNENKDRYIRVCKLLYENDDTRKIINKYNRRLKKIEVIDSTLIIPKDLKLLKNEENIKVLEVLLEFYKGTEVEYFLEERIKVLKSVEYNDILCKFEQEVERIKISIYGYPYEDRINKMEELYTYLNRQRLEIDKNINDNLIFPENY